MHASPSTGGGAMSVADDGVKDVKKKKKKMGKKERMKLKAKQLVEERGMSEADARKEAGLNPIPIPT